MLPHFGFALKVDVEVGLLRFILDVLLLDRGVMQPQDVGVFRSEPFVDLKDGLVGSHHVINSGKGI